jgi:hypothetical protein
MSALEEAARDALELCERIIAGKRIWSLSDVRVVRAVLREALEQTEPFFDAAEQELANKQAEPVADEAARLLTVMQMQDATIKALTAALAKQAEPVAWRYKGEPWFDGDHWHDKYEVTTDERVARFKDKNAQPLYTAPQHPEPVASVVDTLEKSGTAIPPGGDSGSPTF